jgi:CRISPR-associated protein Csm5
LILSLTDQNGTSYGWKQLWNRQNTNNPKFASQIICETLPVGSKGYFSISLNKFLLENPEAKNELKFNEETLKDFKNLVKVINDYSKQKLEEEIKFFESLTSPKKLQTLVIELNKILKALNNLSDEEFILRISWGSGWKGMTGDYLDEESLELFRKKYNLGKRDFPIFPKTRRIVFENDEPKYITGWIRVKLFDSKSQNQTVTKKSSENLSTDNPIDLLKQKFKVREDKKL